MSTISTRRIAKAILVLVFLACIISRVQSQLWEATDKYFAIKTQIQQSAIIWKKATICLENVENLNPYKDRDRQRNELDIKYRNRAISTNEYLMGLGRLAYDTRSLGTAILIKYKDRRYFVSAAHVLRSKRGPSEVDKLFGAPQEPPISDMLFIVPSIEDKFGLKAGCKIPFLMNRGSGPTGLKCSTVADNGIDLAVVSLDQFTNYEFANNLEQAGYSPISFDQIADEPSAMGVQVFTVGYPLVTSIIGPLPLSPTDPSWQTCFLTAPALSFGSVVELINDEPCFWCHLYANPGNSGGPIIENEKLVGIVLSIKDIDKDLKNPIRITRALKAKYIKPLLERQIEKDARINDLFHEAARNLKQKPH